MDSIFEGTYKLKELKLNKATFNSVTEYTNMFATSAVETIYVKDNIVQNFINARLTDVNLNASVLIAN